MSREDRLKSYDAVFVRLLDTTKEGRVKTRLARFNTTVFMLDTIVIWETFVLRINTSSIAVPNIDEQTLDRVTGLHIDILHFETEIDTDLIFFNVLTNKLTKNIVGTSSHLWSKNA